MGVPAVKANHRDRVLLLLSHISIMVGKIQREVVTSPTLSDEIIPGLSNAADQLLDLLVDEEDS